MKVIYALSCALFFCALASSADDKAQEEGVALIQHAVDKTNIFALPSFTMKAAVTVSNQGKDVDGTYQLFWNGPDRWREQIMFPEYGEIRVGGKGVIYLKRTLDFVTPEISALRSALGFGPSLLSGASIISLLPRSGEHVSKIQNRKLDGLLLKCVEIRQEKIQRTREVCVNDSTGTLERGDNYKDEGFAPVAIKLFPRSVSRVESHKVVASVRIAELKAETDFPKNAFDPPQGTSPQPGCMNPEPPLLLSQIPPPYPARDISARTQGSVYIGANIGVEGIPKDFRIVSGPSPELAQAAVDSLRTWRFEPPECSGVRTEEEYLFRINFAINP